MKKRIFILTLILAVLIAFAACSQKEPTPSVALPDEGAASYRIDPETGLPDFRDRDVTFMGDVSELAYEIGSSKWADMRIAHIKKVQNDLHVNFVYEHASVVVNRLQAMLMSGVGDLDVCVCDSVFITPMYKTGVFADLNSIDAIDLMNTEKYGTEALLKFSEYKGGIYSLYGTGSLLWPENVPVVCNALIINDDLIEEFGAVHPLEFYEKQNWNFSTFKSYVSRVTDLDVNHRIYGLDATGGGGNNIVKSALYANGVSIAEEDASGNYTFGYTSPEAVKAVDWAKSLCDMKSSVLLYQRDPEPVFASGKATMYLGSSLTFTNPESAMQQYLENLSYICFPYGNDVEFGSVIPSYYNTPTCTSIVRNGDEQETGYILDYLFEPMEGNLDGEYQSYLKAYFFPENNGSFDLFWSQVNNAVYSRDGQLPDTSRKVENAMLGVLEGTKTPVEAFTPLQNPADTEIRDNLS